MTCPQRLNQKIAHQEHDWVQTNVETFPNQRIIYAYLEHVMKRGAISPEDMTRDEGNPADTAKTKLLEMATQPIQQSKPLLKFYLQRYLTYAEPIDLDILSDTDPKQPTLLTLATFLEDQSSVEKIVNTMQQQQRYVGLHSEDAAKCQPLAKVIALGWLSIAEQLLTMGADPNAISSNGFTPLAAVVTDLVGITRLKAARLLLRYQASDDGILPIHRDSYISDEAFQRFQGKPIRNYFSDFEHNDPLVFLSTDLSPEETKKLVDVALAHKDVSLIEEACAQLGVDIHQVLKGHTPLGWAAANGVISMMQDRIQKDEDPTQDGRDGLPPILWAITKKQTEAINFLLPHLIARIKKMTTLVELASFEQSHAKALTEDKKDLIVTLVRQKDLILNAEKLRLMSRNQLWSGEDRGTTRKCITCFGPLPKDEEEFKPGTGPANCDCNIICNDCAKGDYLTRLLEEKEILHRCGGCNGVLFTEYLERQGVADETRHSFLSRQIANGNATRVGFRFCRNKDGNAPCGRGRVVLPAETAPRFCCEICETNNCMLCGLPHEDDCKDFIKSLSQWKETMELGLLGQDDSSDERAGKYRFCYICGEAENNGGGCVTRTCEKTGQKWDYNVGEIVGQEDHSSKIRRQSYIPMNRSNWDMLEMILPAPPR